MKTTISLIIAISFLTLPSVAATEVFRCNGEFLFPNEDETAIVKVTGIMVINSNNGKQTATLEVDGSVMAKDQEVMIEETGKPQLDMIEQMLDIAAEYPIYARAMKDTYGAKVEDTLKNTAKTTFVGYEQDDGGAILGHHYDVKGNLVSTEISVAWLGTGFCK